MEGGGGGTGGGVGGGKQGGREEEGLDIDRYL